jgi:hypothetical protein
MSRLAAAAHRSAESAVAVASENFRRNYRAPGDVTIEVVESFWLPNRRLAKPGEHVSVPQDDALWLVDCGRARYAP